MKTMAIGLVSESDFQNELTHLGVSTEGGHVVSTPAQPDESHPTSSPEPESGEINEMTRKGRSKGDVNIPDSLRQIIASTHLMDGRDAALQLARDFGISPSSVSAYANGATSTTTYDQPKKSIVDHIAKTRERAVKRASKTLTAALDSITQEKLDYESADKLAGIAKDMSAIIKNLEPNHASESTDSKSSPQFVIFAPQFRDERSFESIHVVE